MTREGEPQTLAGEALQERLGWFASEKGDALRDGILAVETEARALQREFDVLAAAYESDSGTETKCPLEGVHEHAFRGPHRFREWEPGS